jgi:hypothetical protein
MVLTVESNRTRGKSGASDQKEGSAHISSKKSVHPVTHKTRRKALKKVFIAEYRDPLGLVGSDFKF